MATVNRSISDDGHDEAMKRFSEMITEQVHADLAVAAALHHCDKYGRAVPDWLVGPAAALACRLLNNTKPKEARKATPGARYVKDMKDFRRWEVVDGIGAIKRHIKEEIRDPEEIRQLYRRANEEDADVIAKGRNKLRWLGKTWEEALEQASIELQGTFSRANAQVIKKSYSKVNKAVGKHKLQYHRFEDSFLILVELEVT